MKKVFMIPMMLTIFGLSSVFAQVALDSGLVAKYYFNGNANDLSGNGNNGTVYGATLTADRFGNANSAYYFDGVSSYIQVANSSSLNPTNAITLCAWYQPEPFSNDGSTGIIDKGFTSDNPPYYQYRFASPGEYVYNSATQDMFSYGVTINNAQSGFNTPNYFYTVGNWYFLTGTYDGTTLKFYVNDVLIDSSLVSGSLNGYNSPLYIGRNSIDPTGLLKGTVDDIRIYNRALNTDEIQALYYENDCLNMPSVSINGLGTSYTTNSAAITLTGTPAGGIFYGTGVVGNTFNPAIAGAGSYSIVYVYNNNVGCSKATCEGVTVSQGTLKVPEIQNPNNNIKIIPNPNNGKFNVTFTTEQPENVSIQVINILGDIVFTETKNKHLGIYNNNINLNNLSNGNYIVNVKIGERITSEKILITK